MIKACHDALSDGVRLHMLTSPFETGVVYIKPFVRIIDTLLRVTVEYTLTRRCCGGFSKQQHKSAGLWARPLVLLEG